VKGWAEPVLLTDVEMDAIYAQGIFVDLNIDIVMPNGTNLVMPGIEVPLPNMPGVTGNSAGGNTGTMSIAPVNHPTTASNSPSPGGPSTTSGGTTVAAAAPASGGSPTNTLIVPTASAVSIGDNSMTGNSGLIITAPGAAVSILLNIAVFNNSSLNGDFMQSASSKVNTFSFAFSSFNF
jgi:hypothetical protein